MSDNPAGREQMCDCGWPENDCADGFQGIWECPRFAAYQSRDNPAGQPQQGALTEPDQGAGHSAQSGQTASASGSVSAGSGGPTRATPSEPETPRPETARPAASAGVAEAALESGSSGSLSVGVAPTETDGAPDAVAEAIEWLDKLAIGQSLEPQREKFKALANSVRALVAALERAEQRANEYRIEADCALRDCDAMDLERGLAVVIGTQDTARAVWAEARAKRAEQALHDIAYNQERWMQPRWMRERARAVLAGSLDTATEASTDTVDASDDGESVTWQDLRAGDSVTLTVFDRQEGYVRESREAVSVDWPTVTLRDGARVYDIDASKPDRYARGLRRVRKASDAAAGSPDTPPAQTEALEAPGEASGAPDGEETP